MSPPQTTPPLPGTNPAPIQATPAPLLRPYGQYVLVRKLAEGGMAEIFLAKLKGTDGFERNVVIKRMLPHLSSIPDFVEMFRDEARLAAKLSHPNIVQIQELGFADGCYYICMEYLAGEDFSTTVRLAGRRRQYLPIPVVLRVLIDSARGLHFAHEFTNEAGLPLNIVHRDVSPSNLYLTYQGQVKVLDFGIAKAESRLANTRSGVVKGKYMYMAPEQAKGKEVDRRADVFALGVSLYEALTHVRPFARENDLAVLNALLHGEFKRPRELRKDLPQALEAIILKAMAFKPEDRYPSAEAFANALEAFLGEHLSVSGGAHLAAFLRAHFGEERFTERTRIPTLATLTATYGTEGSPVQAAGTQPAGTELSAGGPKPPEVPTAHGVVPRSSVSAAAASAPGTPVPAAVAASPAPTPVPVPVVAPASGGRGWQTLAIGLASGMMLAGAAVVGYRQFSGPQALAPAPVAQVAVAAASPAPAPSPVPETPAAAPAVAAAPAEAAAAPAGMAAPAGEGSAVGDTAAMAAAAPEEPAPGTAADAEPAPAPSSPVEPRAATPKKVVTLGIEDIQRVVSRGRARITACFERYKADLPANEGEVQLQLTIAASGKVQAGTRGPLAPTGVGRCLESQAEKLRFPVHRDKEVSVVMPFSWRVTQ
ncbi:MAG TPA: protein kinase [Myxococcus sp.]|nr:protein kinase [Myxococcus sp.]